MAREDEKTSGSPSLDLQLKALGETIAKGIVDAGNATGPIKQIPITKYKNRTIYNPQGLPPHKRPQFTREYYQNSKIINDIGGLYDEDIRLLNKLKPGRYIERNVEVIERLSDNGQQNQVEIRYPSATIDDRFRMKNYWRTFSEMLRLIVAEQEAEPALVAK
jgi:hypothetical protein